MTIIFVCLWPSPKQANQEQVSLLNITKSLVGTIMVALLQAQCQRLDTCGAMTVIPTRMMKSSKHVMMIIRLRFQAQNLGLDTFGALMGILRANLRRACHQNPLPARHRCLHRDLSDAIAMMSCSLNL